MVSKPLQVQGSNCALTGCTLTPASLAGWSQCSCITRAEAVQSCVLPEQCLHHRPRASLCELLTRKCM
jgi:hypothetical protein